METEKSKKIVRVLKYVTMGVGIFAAGLGAGAMICNVKREEKAAMDLLKTCEGLETKPDQNLTPGQSALIDNMSGIADMIDKAYDDCLKNRESGEAELMLGIIDSQEPICVQVYADAIID